MYLDQLVKDAEELVSYIVEYQTEDERQAFDKTIQRIQAMRKSNHNIFSKDITTRIDNIKNIQNQIENNNYESIKHIYLPLPFKVGARYYDRTGSFEVMTISGNSMSIKMGNGAIRDSDLEIKKQIYQGVLSDKKVLRKKLTDKLLDRRKYENICWKCKQEVRSTECKKCQNCTWLICRYCGKCGCQYLYPSLVRF